MLKIKDNIDLETLEKYGFERIYTHLILCQLELDNIRIEVCNRKIEKRWINMNVYFKNSQGIERLIGTAETEEDCFKIIFKFLDDHNYKSYYQRVWRTDKGKKVDVGSHTEFFYIREEE